MATKSKNTKKTKVVKKRHRGSAVGGLSVKYVAIPNSDNSLFTIIARLKYLGQIAEKTTGIRIANKDDFDRPNLQIVGNEALTMLFQDFHKKIYEKFAILQRSGKDFTIFDLWEQIAGYVQKDEKPLILAAWQLFMEHLKTRNEAKKCSKATIKKHKMWDNRFTEYFKAEFGSRGDLNKILPIHIELLVAWLQKKRGYENNSAQYLAGHFKRFLDFCVAHRWILSNPFLSYKKDFEEKEVKVLTMEEIEQLRNTEIHNEVLNRQRDTFLLMYEFAMNYADIASHKRTDVFLENGKTYIGKRRTKTGFGQMAEINEVIEKIIKKYENDAVCSKNEQLCHIITLQPFNRFLKEIAAICGIEKNLTAGMARASMATHLYEMGVDEKIIQMTLGHRIGSSVTHKNYIQHSPKVMVRRFESLKKNST